MPLVHEEDQESTARAMEAIYSPPHTAYMEQRAMTKDGWKWLAWQDTAVLDEKGNVTAIVGVGRDIDARKKSEEKLRITRDELMIRNRINQAFLTAAGDRIYDSVLDIILDITDSRYGIFGYLDENGDAVVPTMTRHIWDKCQIPDKSIVFPRDSWGNSSWVRCIREKRTIYSNEPSTGIPEGHIQIARHISVPIVFRSEVVGYFQVANRDSDYTPEDAKLLETVASFAAPVLDARLREDWKARALKQAEESAIRFGRIFENSLNEIYLFDTDKLNFIQVNQAAQNNLGYSLDELKRMTPLDLKTEFTAQSFAQMIEPLRDGKEEEITFETTHKRKDQSTYSVEVHLQLLRDERESVFAATILDITEKQKLQAQLIHAQKMESIGNLAGGIAHDLNNILSCILGFTELALGETAKDSIIGNYLHEVYTAGGRARDLIKQIVTLSRKYEPAIKPVSITSLVREVLGLLRATIPSSIAIRENVTSEELVIQGDPTRLHQVMINLVTNAKQAMDDGPGVLKVAVDKVSFQTDSKRQYPGMEPGDYAQITVSDTGSGIPADDLEKIFEPYYTTKAKGEGTGLGLSVVHGIVKSHDGHTAVHSEPGEGAVFGVYFPLIGEAPGERPFSARGAMPAGTEHILLVDDERPVVRLQQQNLEQLGYTVTAKTGSMEALKVFRESPDSFDLIITDMTMPKMTGDKLTEKIKEIRSDIPVVLCTGFSEKLDGHVKDLAIEEFLMKPVGLRKMAKTVRLLLDEARAKGQQH